MNPIEKLLTMINPPVSPVPNTTAQNITQKGINLIKGIPEDIVNSTVAAAKISPPGEVYRRLALNKEYEDKGGVPYQKQLEFTQDDLKNALQASHLFGYVAPIRALMKNPLELQAGQTARMVDGNWKIFDKILNKNL